MVLSSFDFGKDLIYGGGPDERLRINVGGFDVLVDCSDQVRNARERASPNFAFG